MSFERSHLLSGETLVLVTRHHLVVLTRAILLNVLAAIVLGALSYYTGRYWLLTFMVVPLALLGWEILVRHRTEFVVTDHRIVRLEGVLSVSSLDAPLDKINNVFHDQSFLGRILNYGTVGLETASEQGTTLFERVPNPVRFKNLIQQQCEEFRKMMQRGTGNATPDVPRLLEDLASLRDRGIITVTEFEEKKRALLARL